MALVALLSNPRSTGNKALLPRIRSFVAQHPNIFHYEMESVAEVPDALEMISRVKPAVLVINGGDGTVQAALTELYHGGHFQGSSPPVAVLPNGKTNLIALDLGATGDPLRALKQILDIVAEDVPLIPSWNGQNVAVANSSMTGVEETLDPTYIFRFWMISKEG